MRNFHINWKIGVTIVWWFLVRSGFSQCNQLTDINVQMISNTCPPGVVTYAITYSSEIPNGFNSICYGYAITEGVNIVGGQQYGPVDQQAHLNNPFNQQIEVSVTCSQGLSLYLHAWANHACGGEFCHEPYTKVVVLSPLPVKLDKFRADPVRDGIMVSWTTASEVNNQGFYLDHGMIENQWSVLDFIPGSGSVNEPRSYRYLHKNPGKGIHFYRLRQVDSDNTYAYSHVVHAVAGSENAYIYPTVVSDYLYAYSPKEMTFRIYDSMGKMVREGTMGPEVYTTFTGDLRNGLYRLLTENQKTFSFIKF